MPLPGLMEMRRSLRNGHCLSSDGSFIAFTYFLNPPDASLKYLVQFIPIDTPQNHFQEFKN
jgi:hypothetical protein